MKKTNKPVNRIDIVKGIGIGTLVALIVSVICVVLVAALINKEHIAETGMSTYTFGILYAATAIGASIAYKVVCSNCLLITSLTSIMYMTMLYLISILFFGMVGSSILKNGIAIGLGFLSACTVCIITKERSRRRKRSYR